MAIDVRPLTDPGSQDKDATDEQRALIVQVRQVLADLEDQLNTRAQVYTSTDGKIPAGLNRNDILVTAFKGIINILVKNKTGFDSLTAAMIGGLMANSTNFKGVVRTTAAAALTDFPEPNDWGFHYKTNAVTAWKLCFNFDGVLKSVALT